MDLQKEEKANGTVDKYKERLVIKGFRQHEGLDYFDNYSLVTRITSIRMILAIAALRNLEVHQIDVKKAFLNGDLEEEIYMNQPEGFMAPGLKSKFCRLVKSLYDLRKDPKQGHQISPYHWRERFMNYLEEQTDGEAMINFIQNDPKFWTAEEKKTRKIDRLARSLLIQGLSNDIYSLIDSNKTAKYLWDALERQMRGSEYGEQDRKAAILYEYETFKLLKESSFLILIFYGTLMRQTKNLMDINIDDLYNILKQNQGDVNDALGYKKKAVVVHSDPLALVAEKTNVSKQKEKVVVSLDSKGSGADDFSELEKITALLAKAFNRRKFYSKPTNNNLRTSSTSQSANKKQEFVKSDDKKEDNKADEKKRDMIKVECYNCKKEGHFAKDFKKAKVKDYKYYKTKMLLAKKDSDEQVLLAEDQAWMESSSDSDKEINANMVFMAQIEKVLSESDESSSSAEETIAEVSYYTSKSENYDKSEVDHNDFEEKEHLVDKLIQKFNHKIAKCQKRVEKANQQSKDFKNQNKDLQEKYDVLIIQLKEERYEYMIRYSTLFDNDKQHRKQIADQEVLFDKMSIEDQIKDRGRLLGAHGGVLIEELIWCGEVQAVSWDEGATVTMEIFGG
nr:hypothetical protein CTI12_AA013410 [Tanacetum cinerariifolium]